MNINSQIGLSWNEWIRDPENKRLYEWNQAEARKKFLRDEDEYIQQIILQEKIIEDKQRILAQQLRIMVIEQEDPLSVANTTSTSGVGGMAASGGGGFSNLKTGIDNFVVGTYLTADGVQVATAALAGDEGFDRFTVS